MNDSGIVYFSKMSQAVPHLAQVASELPGTFISNRRSTLNVAKSLYPYLNTERYSRFLGSLSKGNRSLAKAEIIVTGSPYRSFLAPYDAKKATVFHGTYMMLSRDALIQNAHFDLLCVIGPRMKTMIGRFSNDVLVNAVETGFLPFCEYPEQSGTQRAAVLQSLGLDPERKTIVYTPSRRGLGSWNLVAERLVSTAPKHLNLVLRPHPSQSITSRRKDRESFGKVQKLIAERSGAFLDLGSRSLAEIVSVADLVVSDANSPSEESMFYDVPQLFIETENLSRDVVVRVGVKEAMHPDDLDRLLTLYDCGPNIFINTKVDFSENLDRAISDASAFSARRETYFSWVFGSRDRLANKRVAEAIRSHII
ncbi:hypothetical protein [Pseudomonas saliphila]|uniref:hypothetical protein n=1 Tax=Pseudomonas saliphila TaxID=2586906 RepID=UPI001238F072|nr:hypothetical protein [Pseudomonas saliphila]